MLRARPARLFALLALLVICPTAAGDGEEEGNDAYALHLPGTAPDHVAAVRVVGFEGGLVPIAGARVTGWSEEVGASTARPAQLLAEAFTDEHGFANLVWKDEEHRPFHWLADAPGKAVRTWHPASGGGSVHLARGGPYAVRVLSSLGTPLANARLEYYIYGCPHSPAARVGVTDAEGLVVFDGLPVPEEENPDPHNEWGQFWITAEGVAAGRHYAPARRTDGTPVTILTEPGRSLEGSVLDEEGKPVAGVVVRGGTYPRGPVTRTDAAGRFRLVGIEGGADVTFHDPSDLLDGEPNGRIEDFEPDVPIRLTLRQGRASTLGDREDGAEVAVQVAWRLTPQPPPSLDGVPVRLVRLSDGLVVAGETGESGPGRFEDLAPPGRYRVIVGGGFSPALREAREVDLPAETPVRFELAPAARLVVEGLDAGEVEAVAVRLPGSTAYDVGEEGHTTWLPPDAPAVLWLDRDGPVLLPVGPAENGLRRVTAPPYRVAEVRLRVRSSDPAVPADDVEVRWVASHLWAFEAEEEDGVWTLTTPERRPLEIRVEARGFQERAVVANLGPESRAVDLEEVVLHPLRRRVVRFLHADGTVPDDVSLHWGVRGRHGNELQHTDGSFELDLGPRPEPAVLRGEGIHPFPAELSEASPGEIRLPGGRLDLRVRDAEGRPLAFVAYVDHVRRFGQDGALTLRAIPAGPHTVIVGARDHLGVVREVELSENGSKTLEITLPRR